jgi:hypothetical protein
MTYIPGVRTTKTDSKTISSGNLTLPSSTVSVLSIRGEGNTDDTLVTMTTPSSSGFMLWLTVGGSEAITIQHGTGSNNFRCPDGIDITIDQYTWALLRSSGTFWDVLSLVPSSSAVAVDTSQFTDQLLGADSTDVTLHNVQGVLEYIDTSFESGLFEIINTDNIVSRNDTSRELSAGVSNIYAGIDSALYGDGSYNVAVGKQALEGTTGNDFNRNVGVGFQVGISLTTGSDNVFIGHTAGNDTQDGYSNVYIGRDAGYYGTSAYDSVCIGKDSGFRNVTGAQNTFVGTQAGTGVASNSNSYNCAFGYRALQGITTGTYNVAVGLDSLYSITESDFNTAVGAFAGHGNTTGNNNVFIGDEAGYYTEADSDNVIIGYQAGYGTSGHSQSQCVIIGSQAGFNVEDTADGNILVGYQAGYSITSEDNSVKIGYQAGFIQATGRDNVFIGYQAGYGTASTNANNTIAIGYRAGYEVSNIVGGVFIGNYAGLNNQSGGQNTVVGYSAFRNNEGGAHNTVVGYQAANGVLGNDFSDTVIIGYQAGYSIKTGGNNVIIGSGAGYDLDTGQQNVLIGYGAGENITDGPGNTCIGYQTGNNIITGDYNIIIGYDIDPDDGAGNYQFMLGSASYPFLKGDMQNYILQINGPNAYLNFDTTAGYEGFGIRDNNGIMEYKDSGGSWTTFASLSDISLKENVRSYDLGLDFVSRLKTRRFNFKNKSSDEPEEGLIAQEVRKILDDLGIEFSGWIERPDGLQELRYNKFVIPLINAVKEQQNQLEKLKERISNLEGTNKD